MPKKLILAELFLMAICFIYMGKISGIVLDIKLGTEETTIIADISKEFIYNRFMLFLYMFFMLLAIIALTGIESGRIKSWRKVVRSCLAFAIPVFTSLLVYKSNSCVHLFDMNPYLSLAIAYGIVLLMILSTTIREYYTPVGKEPPKILSWCRYVVYGKLFD